MSLKRVRRPAHSRRFSVAPSTSPGAWISDLGPVLRSAPVLPCARRNVRGGLGWGPRRKAALWAKGEPLGGRGRVYPGPGVWLGVAPLSAATAAPGLCWPPDVSWLQPAGPPHPAHRGALSKAAVRRPGRPPGSSLLAPSPRLAEPSELHSGFCAQVFLAPQPGSSVPLGSWGVQAGVQPPCSGSGGSRSNLEG